MPRLAKLIVDRRDKSKAPTGTSWKRAQGGNSGSEELGDIHHPHSREEVVTRIGGGPDVAQQEWSPIKV